MKKNMCVMVGLGYLVLLVLLLGCFREEAVKLHPKSPTVVTFWHSYNTYAKKELDGLILEFNETAGMERGIVIDAYVYGDAARLEKALYNSANKIIGADPMPHLFTAYPDSAYRVGQLTPLVELNKYFKDEELAGYRTEFLAEGLWNGHSSPMLVPVAKSTEILYLNQTGWDQFASEVGVSADLLKTWEGLLTAAEKYYAWSGGKALLGFNPFNDFAFLTAAQLESRPYSIKDGTASFGYSRAVARRVWEICYIPHLKGWYKSEMYGSDGIKSGGLLAYLGSSAGVGFFPDEVTLNEREIYPIQCKILPYPTFQNAARYIGQRGAGMSITVTDPLHEYAAAEFVKWFTAPERNAKFAVSTGYIPVEIKAAPSLQEMLGLMPEARNSDIVKQGIEVTLQSMAADQVYIREPFDGSYEVNTIFSNSLFKKIQTDLRKLEVRVKNGESREAAVAEMIGEEHFNAWYDALFEEVSERLSQKR